MQNNSLSPSETLHLHEILMFKNTCAMKSSVMSGEVTDQQLKGLINQDITNTKRQIQELQNMLTSTNTTFH